MAQRGDRKRMARMALSVGLGGLLTLASLGGTTGCTSDEGASSSASATRTTSARSRGASTIEARRRAFQVNHDDWGRLGYRLDWRGFAHVGPRQRVTHLTPYDDIVVVHESGSVLSVLEADTGAVRNANELATPLTRFLGHVREGSRVIVSSESELFAVDVTTGNLLDRKSLAKVASTSPVLAEGLIINGTPSGEASAYMLGAPVRAWAFGMGDPIDTDPVIVGDAIGLVSRSGNVAFLDAASGSLLGRARVFAGCDATPASDGSTMFIASLDQSVYAFHARGGELAWRVRTARPLRQQPIHHQGVVYVGTDDRGLLAFDAATGAERWAAAGVTGTVIGVRAGRLLVFNGREAFTLDPDTGDIVERALLPGVAILRPDAFVDGNLYAVSAQGVVAKFVPRS